MVETWGLGVGGEPRLVKWGTVAGMPLPAVEAIADKAARRKRTVKTADRSRSARVHLRQGGIVVCKATVPLEATTEDAGMVDCGNCLRQLNANGAGRVRVRAVKREMSQAVSPPEVAVVSPPEAPAGQRDVKDTLAPAQVQHPPAQGPGAWNVDLTALEPGTNGDRDSDPVPQYRICRGPCHEAKLLDAFARDAKDKIHGRKQICKDCDNARRRSYPKVKAEVAA